MYWQPQIYERLSYHVVNGATCWRKFLKKIFRMYFWQLLSFLKFTVLLCKPQIFCFKVPVNPLHTWILSQIIVNRSSLCCSDCSYFLFDLLSFIHVYLIVPLLSSSGFCIAAGDVILIFKFNLFHFHRLTYSRNSSVN